MKRLCELQLSGQRVLLRADLNVVLGAKGTITDDSRLEAILPTLRYILGKGASVVLISHLGRPKGPDKQLSLQPVAHKLSELMKQPVDMAADCVGEEAKRKSAALAQGSILVLENLRFHAEETTPQEAFAKELSAHGHCYVNDAFGTAHRMHASTVLLAKYFEEKGMGLLIEHELKAVERVLKNPRPPSIAIAGGAKVSDKVALLNNLSHHVQALAIGGAMANTFSLAMGGSVGASLVEEKAVNDALLVVENCKKTGVPLHLPVDVHITRPEAPGKELRYCAAGEIPKGWAAFDIGPATMLHYQKVIQAHKTLLWNGPMGVTEIEPFGAGTAGVAAAVATATAAEAGNFSLVGGGDSLAALKKLGQSHAISHLSTGGGALLCALEGSTLPALEAL